MGSNTLLDQNDNEVADASDVNQVITALKGDLIPRNNSGVVEDIFGSLGTSVYRFLSAYLSRINLGATASGITIEEDSTDVIIKIGGTTVFRLKSSGLTFNSRKGNAFSSSVTDLSNGDMFLSSSSGTTSIGSSETVITNFTKSLTVSGKNPIEFSFIPDGSSTSNRVSAVSSDGIIRLYRDSTLLESMQIYASTGNLTASSVRFIIAPPSAGTYTFQVRGISPSGSLIVEKCKLLVRELN